MQLATPQNCISPFKIKEFLSRSRRLTDDNIQDKLSAHGPSYFHDTIEPEWEKRESLINYCDDYAQQLRKGIATGEESAPQFDLRQDPYALKNYQEKLRANFDLCESVETWVRNERTVERIVRENTMSIMSKYDD